MSDWRLAVRSLARRPGFATVAVLTLALGIGASTALFTVVDGVLLRPLPYPDPGRVVTVWQTNPAWRHSGTRLESWWDSFPLSYPEYENWRDLNHSFTALGVFEQRIFEFSGGSERPELLAGQAVTADLFAVLSVPAALGRTFLPEEDHRGAPAVAVLSDGLWRRAFGADPSILGRTITLDDHAYTVVGVMPRGFYFPDHGTDVWTLLPDESRQDSRTERSLECVARLKKGVTLDAARVDMEAVQGATMAAKPGGEHLGVRLIRRLDEVVGWARPVVLLLFGAAGLVLLIACANVANLLLVRATGRRRELAVRAALGAGRARLTRELVVESLLLSAAGGAVGVGVALATLGSLKRLLPPMLPRLLEIAPDARVLAFAVAATLLTGLVAAVLPVLGVTRVNLAAVLQDGVRGGSGDPRRRRVQGAIVVGEIALAFVLLAGATLLARSFVRLTSVPLGFDPSGVFTLGVRPPGDRYDDTEAISRFFEELTAAVAALPGVERVATTDSLPLGGGTNSGNAIIERPTGTDEVQVEQSRVSAGYFAALRIPIVAGRAFTDADDAASQPVVIVSRAMAERYWPGQSPLGRRLKRGGGSRSPWATVVGIAADVHHQGFAVPARPKIYLSLAQWRVSPSTLIIKTAGEPAGLAAAVRQAAWTIEPSLLLVDVESLSVRLARSVAEPRSRTLLLSAMALLAAVLAVVGVYGVMAFAVTERTLEIGIRMALGAEARQVLRAVLGRGLALAAAGLAAGAVVAVFSMRLLQGFLFQVHATDPWTMIGVAAVVAAAALAASAVPAWRAARIDPAATLRS